MDDNDEIKYASSSMKIPIFNGTDKSKYQEWEDDLIAVFEYHDIEEYVEDDWKDIKMPDKSNTSDLETRQRKEMKKAKAILVRATSQLPSMIAKEAQTPYEALSKLREKYSVKKIREDFDTLDSEWNNFKIDDVSTDPDLVFKTLEEQSKKLAVFGERYGKDSLQMLSKLACSLPNEYDHVFTYLNTNEERSKSFDEQLDTAKAMIASHYKTKVLQKNNSSSMIFMLSGDKFKREEKPRMKCDFCGKDNHTAYKDGKPFCYKLKKKLKRENKNQDKSPKDQDINSLFVNCIYTTKKEFLGTSWLGDTGAQCHVLCASDEESGPSKNKIKMGNHSSSDVLRYEDITLGDESGQSLILKNTRVVKGMATNVISLLQLVDEGWKMLTTMKHGKKKIEITKNNVKFTFCEGQRKNLCFLTAEVTDNKFVGNVMNEEPQESYAPWPYDDFHDKFGHHGDVKLRLIAQRLGYKLIGKPKSCDACNLIKAKAKSIPKITKSVATKVGERVGLDITGPFPMTSGINHRPINQKLYWFGIIDHYSKKMINAFHCRKDALIDFVTEAQVFMTARKTPIRSIRMDNAGENLAVEKFCNENNIAIEYTPPDTPKLNGVIERAFAIRWEKAKILLQAAGLKDKIKKNKKILTQAIKTACFLTEECPTKDTKCANDLFYGSNRKFKVKPKHFIEWGRVGFVANKRTRTTKMKARGVPMLMVGYAFNHPSGTYEMYNPTTNTIVLSNSVKWTAFNRWDVKNQSSNVGKMLHQPVTPAIKIADPEEPSKVRFAEDPPLIHDDDVDTDISSEAKSLSLETLDESLSKETSVSPRRTRSQGFRPPPVVAIDNPTVQRALDKLSTSPSYKVTGNTTATPIFSSSNDDASIHHIFTDDMFMTYSSAGGMSYDSDNEDDILDMFLFHTCIQSDPGEPKSWKEALQGPEREWWIKSMTAEFNNFLSRGAWEFVDRSIVYDRNRKLIPTKLVFKKKDEIDGTIRFKTRDVTLGFMMIPGVDFTERFSPVATDEALRLQIAINLKFYHKGWITRSCDVEAAFLESDMDTDMYIEPHPAMVACGFMTENQRKQTAIKLLKSMYGNVDAAIKFFKTLTKHITQDEDLKLKQSKTDPCVFYKLSSNNSLMLIVSVTVDDCAITGTDDDINWFMDGLEKRFKITRDGVISKHLGVHYEWGENAEGKKYCRATMNKKVDAAVTSYEKHVDKEARVHRTPGIPNLQLVKNDGEPDDIDMYRSLVGQVMFFTTKVGLKTGAATRALSAHMSNPGSIHWKALERLIGFLKGMELKGITYLEPESFQVIALADTDFANCRETRRSVGCSIITVGGCVVDWWMAKHHTVSDSSCEAEYKELAKCAKGVKFIQMLLQEFNLVEYPGLIGEDNQGAIFLAENLQVSQRTKHIDTKFHFIREFISTSNEIQYGKLFKIDTKYNTADIGTKNVDVQTFIRHEKEIDQGMVELRKYITKY